MVKVMEIYGLTSNDIWSASGLDQVTGPVVSVVGAGGKTSLIQNMSQELNKRKMNHRILTTTHMWPGNFGRYGQQIGIMNDDGKVSPVGEKMFGEIFEIKAPVLIEADGSKGLPCKAPESWEPVLRPETTHVFAVLGASCLGKKVSEICHRPKRVMAILSCSGEHCLTEEDLAVLASSRRGLRKDVREDWKYTVIINQVDNPETYDKIKHIEKIFWEKGVENVFFTRMR